MLAGNSFSSASLAFKIFAILAFPLIIVWSLVSGIIIGIIGSTVNFFQVQRREIKEEIIAITKYPGWREDEFKNQSLYFAEKDTEKARLQYEFREGKKAPRMVKFIFIQMILGSIIFYPYLLFRGILLGPVFACRQSYNDLWNILNFKGGKHE